MLFHHVTIRTCLLGTFLSFAGFGLASWPTSFNDVNNGNDLATVLAGSPNGDVTIAGNTTGNGTGTDIEVVRYDSSGAMLWTRVYGQPDVNESVVAAASDADGNFYLTGITTEMGTEDFVTVKYSPTGTMKWGKDFNGAANKADHPVAMAVGPTGNVVVTGFVQGSGFGIDMQTIQYSPTGKLLWKKTYSTPGDRVDIPRDVAIDTNGDIYLATRPYGGSANGYDFGAMKYSQTGTLLWTRKLAGQPGGSDSGASIALDSDHNAIVTGKSVGLSGSADFMTVKFASDGTRLWSARYGSATKEETPTDVKVDSAGNSYVTGTAATPDGLSDVLTVMYDPAGNKLWAKTYTGHKGAQNSSDTAIALEIVGGSVIVGCSVQTDDATPQTHFAFLKYSATTGVRIYAHTFDLGTTGNSVPRAMGMDPSTGRVFMTGSSHSDVNGTDDFFTIRS